MESVPFVLCQLLGWAFTIMESKIRMRLTSTIVHDAAARKHSFSHPRIVRINDHHHSRINTISQSLPTKLTPKNFLSQSDLLSCSIQRHKVKQMAQENESEPIKKWVTEREMYVEFSVKSLSRETAVLSHVSLSKKNQSHTHATFKRCRWLMAWSLAAAHQTIYLSI